MKVFSILGARTHKGHPSPLRGLTDFSLYPGLAPWAAFFRRFAADFCRMRPNERTGDLGFTHTLKRGSAQFKTWGLRLADETRASQIVEFAVALPLLIFVAVGIFDFGSAFTVKEKIASIAATAARVGASQPSNDLSVTTNTCAASVSACAVRDVVSRSLLDSGLKDCGLASKAPANGGTGSLTWTFTTSTGCPTALTLKVERGVVYATTLSPPFNTTPLQVVGTRVTLRYPYQWLYSKPLGLFGGSYTNPTQITSIALMQNLN